MNKIIFAIIPLVVLFGCGQTKQEEQTSQATTQTEATTTTTSQVTTTQSSSKTKEKVTFNDTTPLSDENLEKVKVEAFSNVDIFYTFINDITDNNIKKGTQEFIDRATKDMEKLKTDVVMEQLKAGNISDNDAKLIAKLAKDISDFYVLVLGPDGKKVLNKLNEIDLNWKIIYITKFGNQAPESFKIYMNR
ncbi:Uncharacterised protein [Granulicatella adiacens]|uniref:hypothetical protein n=1 Tax=Granulicatella adiacens TaxID=46124 RepID=UPI00195B7B8C|nr:hypothetical protein [Granulicatella adiacens]VTX60582.1 Uncharacterised protein [Granulicatella adiacens]